MTLNIVLKCDIVLTLVLEVVMFKKLKDKTKEAAATAAGAASNLARSDSMNSLNSTNSGFSGVYTYLKNHGRLTKSQFYKI